MINGDLLGCELPRGMPLFLCFWESSVPGPRADPRSGWGKHSNLGESLRVTLQSRGKQLVFMDKQVYPSGRRGHVQGAPWSALETEGCWEARLL